MPTTRRNYTTQEERTKQVIDKGNPTNSKLNKLVDYMSQPNIREFNAIVVDKSFERLKKTNRGRPSIFSSRDECIEEVEGYFKLCYQYQVLPTIASLALYLGYGRETLYDYVRNDANDFSDVLKNAINTCQSYQELPALDGTLSAPTWIFTAKNYFNMKDTQDVSISATNQPQNNAQTINAIKEQITSENNAKLIDITPKN